MKKEKRCRDRRTAAAKDCGRGVGEGAAEWEGPHAEAQQESMLRGEDAALCQACWCVDASARGACWEAGTLGVKARAEKAHAYGGWSRCASSGGLCNAC